MTEPRVDEADIEATASALERGEGVLVDVREDFEWRRGHAAGARHIPLMELPSRLAELAPDAPVYLMCATGSRSGHAAEYLGRHGFARAVNVRGGTVAWAKAGLPIEREG